VPFSDGAGRPNSAVAAINGFHGHKCADHPPKQSHLMSRLQNILEAAVEATHADKGTVQLLNAKTGALEVVGQVGFAASFLKSFEHVPPGYAVCGVAMQRRERVVVTDVGADRFFYYLRDAFAAGGIMGCQSSPILHASGSVLGVMSTHSVRPFELPADVIDKLDALVGKAREAIEGVADQELIA
jgi:hypothetical protein